jgi:hypothetical protein
MIAVVRTISGFMLGLALLPVAAYAAPPAWPDTFLARVEALALLQTLNADLLSHDSATLTLERWCGAHKLASTAQIVADRVHGADKPATDETRHRLAVDAAGKLGYRHVKLSCGTVVLSEADNWYVPSRLTPEMNQQLDASDTPFGRVVQPLHFQRHTLSATLLWNPLPPGWEMTPDPGAAAGARLSVPPAILQHRAVLSLPDGTPFSEVVETYSSNVLGFPPPPGGAGQ